MLRSFDRGAETKSDVGVKVTFRGCVDVIDREAFEGDEKRKRRIGEGRSTQVVRGVR